MAALGPPLALELGLGLLILVVFFSGLFHRSEDRRSVGIIAVVGLTILLGLSWRMEPGQALLGGSFVQDDLAIFAKRLFLVATIIGILGSLGLRAPAFARRATEYYLAILASLLLMAAFVVSAPFAFLTGLPWLLQQPWLSFATLPLALAGAVSVYGMLVAAAARMFSRREPEFLERALVEE